MENTLRNYKIPWHMGRKGKSKCWQGGSELRQAQGSEAGGGEMGHYFTLWEKRSGLLPPPSMVHATPTPPYPPTTSVWLVPTLLHREKVRALWGTNQRGSKVGRASPEGRPGVLPMRFHTEDTGPHRGPRRRQ